MQAANRVSNGVSKKVAGTIGGGCLFTGVLCGILGGACLVKLFNYDAATFSLQAEDLNKLNENVNNVFNTSNDCKIRDKSMSEIFSKETQNMINDFKDCLSGWFGIKAYFISDFYHECNKALADLQIKAIKADPNKENENKRIVQARDDCENANSKPISMVLEICKAYDACISKFTTEQLKELRGKSTGQWSEAIRVMCPKQPSLHDTPLKKLKEVCNNYVESREEKSNPLEESEKPEK